MIEVLAAEALTIGLRLKRGLEVEGVKEKGVEDGREERW